MVRNWNVFWSGGLDIMTRRRKSFSVFSIVLTVGLPAIGAPGKVVQEQPTGLLQIERLTLSNGVKVLLWNNDAEPGRVMVKARFGRGYSAIRPQDAAYVALGNAALVGSGLGTLGQDELDRISTGRKMGFDFSIERYVEKANTYVKEALSRPNLARSAKSKTY